MKQTRRAFVAITTAAIATPALPSIAADFAPWPPEIVELNKVALRLVRLDGNLRMSAMFVGQADIEAAECFEAFACEDWAELEQMQLEHAPAKQALRRYREERYLTPAPDWKLPFVREGGSA